MQAGAGNFDDAERQMIADSAQIDTQRKNGN